MLVAKLYQTVDENRRIEARPSLDRPGTLRIVDACPEEIFVRDLTRDGCRLTTSLTLKIDATVAIGLAGVGLSFARVRWGEDGDYGCSFEQSLRSGAITAAFSGSNVAALAHGDQGAAATDLVTIDAKWQPRSRLALIAGLAIGAWAVVGTIVIMLCH